MIQFLKLRDDAEIIADMEKIDNKVKLTNPIRIGLTQQGVAMMPYNPFISDKEITIPEDYVVYTAELDDDMKNEYNAKFGTGLVVPKSGLLLS